MVVSIATSRLGLRPMDVFGIDGYTPLELYNAFKDNDKQTEFQHRSRAVIMRMQTVAIANMFRKKKDQIKNPQSIMRFSWEDDLYSQKEQTVEQQVEVLTMVFGKPKRKKDG